MVDAHPESLARVRRLLSGGDVLSVPHVRRMLSLLPDGATLINGYGPTENTTFTCCHVMDARSEIETTVPIGRPIANTRVYVLDHHNQPVPTGVPGQLHITGDGLANGYHNQPQLTNQHFIPNPYEPGTRLYRTGDLVRHRHDHTLEFLGRLDTQVKIRGYRIECGEIETTLTAYDGVEQAAVVKDEPAPGEQRLVAYVVAGSPTPPAAADLRRHLQARLPEHMIPSLFVVQADLPLTPNGKIDRAALHAPVQPQRVDGERVGPRNPAEQQLARLWSDVLRLEDIGVHDDFFADLGGHSLIATQLVARIRDAFAVELPLAALFEGPTVAELAAQIEELIIAELEALPDGAESANGRHVSGAPG